MALAGGGVVINTRRSSDQADALAAEVQARGGPVLVHLADVTDEVAVQAMVDAALTRFGRIDILVNNAADGQQSPLTEISLAEWLGILVLNSRLWLVSHPTPYLLAGIYAPIFWGVYSISHSLLDLLDRAGGRRARLWPARGEVPEPLGRAEIMAKPPVGLVGKDRAARGLVQPCLRATGSPCARNFFACGARLRSSVRERRPPFGLRHDRPET